MQRPQLFQLRAMWYRKGLARVYIARALRELAGLPPFPAA
jgi:hypothetical protein